MSRHGGELELLATIGFEGKVKGGLKLHNDCSNLIYALGNTIVIKDITRDNFTFLNGHTNSVSCLGVSKSGQYLASGQINFMGFKAKVIIWDFKKQQEWAGHELHKVKVEAVSFSASEQYLLSLGGPDDGCVIVWNILRREPLCGCQASQGTTGNAYTLCAANTMDDIFITGGRDTLRVWKLDPGSRRIHPTNVSLGQIKRDVQCIQMDKDDEHCYCGTTSGDILKIRIRLEKGENGVITVCPVLTSCLTRKIPKKKKDEPLCFSKGVTALILLKSGQMIVGTGNGTICRVVEKEMDTPSNLYNVTASSLPKTTTNKGKGEIRLLEVKRTSVHGSVTSITPRGDGHQLFIGTNTCQIYRINLMEFSCHLLYTCHSFPVLDVTFPYDCSQLFATCSKEHIRIWNISSGQELLRVTVPNMTCHSIEFMRDGKSIISAWDDGKIRAFTPRTGQTIFTINDAHNRGVTAITTTTDCKRIISGGGEGEVRVWDITASKQVLRETMKEHKGPVSCIKVRSNDKECISASTDGTCIIWDLQRFIRSQVIFANTLFKCVCYGPEECQLITSGTDRKIGYWEVYDGSLIRELEGSKSGSVNAMDISHDGQVFVTGGNDKIVKVWKYQEGEVTHVGIGHSGDINKLKISPTDQYIVTVSNDGAILIWSFPKL